MTSSLSKLGLGTAQFGLDQPPGPRGRPRDAEARDILGFGYLEPPSVDAYLASRESKKS